jgi:hypothetical protein
VITAKRPECFAAPELRCFLAGGNCAITPISAHTTPPIRFQ